MKSEVRRLLASLPKSEEAERLFHPDHFTRDGYRIHEVGSDSIWYKAGEMLIGEGASFKSYLTPSIMKRLY